MTDYSTHSVYVSGRPIYTRCDLDFLNVSLFGVLAFRQMSSVVRTEFHHDRLLNSPVSQQKIHTQLFVLVHSWSFAGLGGGDWLVQGLLFYPDGRVDGLTASFLPTQDVFAELRRVHSSAAWRHHGEAFLEQSLQHLSRKSEVENQCGLLFKIRLHFFFFRFSPSFSRNRFPPC